MVPPSPDEDVIELILHRDAALCKAAGVRGHEAHPAHEAAMRARLPASLQILRLDGCRIRTWPVHLPVNIQELYAGACDFFTLPDLSAYTNLIVIEMPDNRIETLNAPLPPSLARLNMDNCALRELRTTPPATLRNISFSNNPDLLRTIEEEGRAHIRAVHAALAAQQTPPPRPPSKVPTWAGIHIPQARINPGPGGPNTPAKGVNPYTNDHNVHDSGIQDSTRANLKYIATYKPDVPPLADVAAAIYKELNKDTPWIMRIWPLSGKSLATNIMKEIRLRCEQPYVMHGYMPAEIVDRLWVRILDFEGETRKEVLQRFVDEILEAEGHCTNGFMVRLANVLIGYDENVVMKMRPTQILQARIPATMERVRKTMGVAAGAEPPEFWTKVIRQTWEDMEEIDMVASERGSWITGLMDGILDTLTEGITKDDRATTAYNEDGTPCTLVDKKINEKLTLYKLYMAAKRVGEIEQPGLDHYIRRDVMASLQETWRS
jgi:hypothetical protein